MAETPNERASLALTRLAGCTPILARMAAIDDSANVAASHRVAAVRRRVLGLAWAS